MPMILLTELKYTPSQFPPIAVSIVLNFTARQIEEDVDHCVHTAIVRVRDDQVIFTKISGSYESMDIFSIPASTNLQVGYTRVRAKSGGNAIVNLLVPIRIDSPVASGDRIQAVVSVVPETALTLSGTQEMTIP